MSKKKNKHSNPEESIVEKTVHVIKDDPEGKNIEEQKTDPAEETADVKDIEAAAEPGEAPDPDPAAETGEGLDPDPAEETAETQIPDPAAETAQAQDIVPAAEAEDEQDIDPEEEPAENGRNAWMKEIKAELKSITDLLERGASGKKEETEEDNGGVKEMPVRSKDDLQKELESIKAQFTHTPMQMTPELEKLLKDDIRDKGKKDKKRGTQMLSVLAKHNFYANGITPEELRTTLEDLGPTYVKIGQIMSSRVDLLPESYCLELEKLRQNVKELDPAVVRAIIEAETGKKIDEIYSEFRDKPIGSASIGQVHYGVLLDGTKVVTKVQRPLIQEIMEKDFELLKKLAPLVSGVTPAGEGGETLDLVTIIEEFEKVTKEELDFRIEAANTRYFKEVILNDGKTTCPAVIDELTTERIFTMTFVDGCSIGEKDELIKQGLDPEQAGRDILESYMHQVFDVGIFHADPHQGNIMASEGRIHWIDFGMIGQITESDMNSLQDLVLGLLSGDVEGMTNGVLTIGTSSPETDRNKLKEDLEAFSAKYMNATSLNDIDFSAVLGEVCDLSDRHHVVMPGRFTMLVRSFITIEGLMEQLCPELNLFELISDKLMERVKKTYVLEKEILALGRGVIDTGKKVSRIPQLIADALNDIMKGRLKINLELTGYQELLDGLNEKINDLILVIVGCVLFSGGCRLCQTDIKPMTPNGMPLFAVIILILGISLILFALKRIFRKK